MDLSAMTTVMSSSNDYGDHDKGASVFVVYLINHT